MIAERAKNVLQHFVRGKHRKVSRDCPQSLDTPLLPHSVEGFYDSIGVGNQHVPGIESNRALRVTPVRKHPDRCATVFEPTYRSVTPNDHGRVVPCIDEVEKARRAIE